MVDFLQQCSLRAGMEKENMQKWDFAAPLRYKDRGAREVRILTGIFL